MSKPNSDNETLLFAISALVVQFVMVYGISWLGWWAIQPIFPALDYPRFGVGAAALFIYLQGAFKSK
jgi:hypothetical protein